MPTEISPSTRTTLVGGINTFAIPSATTYAPPPPPAQGSAAFQAAALKTQTLGSAANLASTDPTVQANVHLAELWCKTSRFLFSRLPRAKLRKARAMTWRPTPGCSRWSTSPRQTRRVTAWDIKYSGGGIRPITALNPTYITDGWQPLLTTPNHPEYYSGHSVTASAAFNVLADFYGTDAIPGGAEVNCTCTTRKPASRSPRSSTPATAN